MFKFPATVVDFSILPFSSISFWLTNFEGRLLGVYTLKILISWKMDCVKSFFILDNIPYCEAHIV